MNLDQTIFNWATGIVGSLAGFLVKAMWDAIKDLRKDNTRLSEAIGALSDKIGREYVRRDDYRDDITEMKGMLVRIFDKLDEKVDKP